MYSNIFDSHAHYTDSKFEDIRKETLDSLTESGVSGVINCSTNVENCLETLELCNTYNYIYGAVGIHPEDIDGLQSDYLDNLRKFSNHPKCVAVGEIGLDYYWRQDNKKEQKRIFIEQIKLANELGLPVIVHDREAHEDTLNILKEYKPKGVVHCFSGSKETAKEILKLGMYIGFGGALTFKNAKKPVEAAEIIPIDKLLLETDCPYMAPVPMRGKINLSSYIPYVAEKLAEIKGISPQEILNITAENAKTLFGIE